MISNQSYSPNDDNIRHLTYLQLCVLPSLIQPYLTSMDSHTIKTSFYMHLQTFSEMHPEVSRYGHSTIELTNCLKQIQKKPLGMQLIHLLKQTLLFTFNHHNQAYLIILELENNTELQTVNLIKVLLQLLIAIEDFKLNKRFVNCLLGLIDFSWELLQVKRGNSKFIISKCSDIQNKLNCQKNIKLQEIELTLKTIRLQEHKLKGFSDYGIDLIKKYKFTMFQKYQKQTRKDQQALLVIQDEDINPNLQQYEDQLKVNKFYYYLTNIKEKQEFVTNLMATSLKNTQQMSWMELKSVHNTILLLIHQILERASDKDELKTKSNLYCLLLSSKILLARKSNAIDWCIFSKQIQQSFKQVMDFCICNLKQTCIFVLSFMSMNLQDQFIYQRVLSFIEWIRTVYLKQNFQEEDIIYAESIIICKMILPIWKKYKNKQNQINLAQLQAQGKNLMIKINLKIKEYGQANFRFLLQGLNSKLLLFIGHLALKAKINMSHKPSIQKPDFENHYESLMTIFQEKVNQSLRNIFNVTSEYGLNDKPMLDGQQYLTPIFCVILQKNTHLLCPLQLLIQIRCLQILNLIRNSKLSLKSNKNKLQQLIKRQLLQILKLLTAKTNILLIQCSVTPNKKNNQNLTVNDSAQVKTAMNLLQNLNCLTVFLLATLYTVSPTNNYQFMLHGLVFNTFSNKQIQQQQLVQLYYAASKKHPFASAQNKYSEILKYANRYDLLQTFYQSILKVQNQKNADWPQLQKEFQSFSRQWCGQENHYQWFSQSKHYRLKLLNFKQYIAKMVPAVSAIDG